MRKTLTSCLLFASLFSLAAVAEPTRAQQDRNRRYLDKLAQADPEHFARLERLAAKFASLTAERREQLLKLDQSLHELPAAVHSHLESVAGRYSEWLDGLTDADRQKIKQAPDKDAKLRVIRELRETEWLKYQPKRLREQIAGMKGADRAALIGKVKKEERERRRQWLFAGLFWDELQTRKPLPARLADFGLVVENFVNEYLYPRLSKEEKDRLERAQGRWPDFPVALVEVADRHPPALPGDEGPKYFKDLPLDVKLRLAAKGKKAKEVGAPPALFKAQGQWPQFGQAIAQYARKTQLILPNEFLAYRYQCLSQPTKDFYDKTLWPILDEDEKQSINKVEGVWPAYPQTLQTLAQKHNLQMPWLSLPRGWDDWKKYRLKSAPE